MASAHAQCLRLNGDTTTVFSLRLISERIEERNLSVGFIIAITS